MHPHQQSSHARPSTEQVLEVIAAFQKADDAAVRLVVGDFHPACVAQAKSASTSRRLAKRIRRCASKPAEMMTRSGENPRCAAGSCSPSPRGSSHRWRFAASGALTMLSCSPRSLIIAPVPG